MLRDDAGSHTVGWWYHDATVQPPHYAANWPCSAITRSWQTSSLTSAMMLKGVSRVRLLHQQPLPCPDRGEYNRITSKELHISRTSYTINLGFPGKQSYYLERDRPQSSSCTKERGVFLHMPVIMTVHYLGLMIYW